MFAVVLPNKTQWNWWSYPLSTVLRRTGLDVLSYSSSLWHSLYQHWNIDASQPHRNNSLSLIPGGCVLPWVESALVYIPTVICWGSRTLAGRDWQTVKVTDPLQGKSHHQFASPWRFILMIIPWCMEGQSRLCLLLDIYAPHLCPLMVKYTNVFRHLFKAPSSLLPSFLIWSLPPHCSTATLQPFRAGGSRDTWILPLFHWYCSPSRAVMRRQSWCGVVWEWEASKYGDSTPPWPLGALPSLESNVQRCVGLLSQEELEPSDFLPADEVTGLSGSVCEMPAQ